MDIFRQTKRNRIADFLGSFTVVEWAIIATIIALLGAMALGAVTQVSRNDQLYEAWCKLENRHDITRDEWYNLKSAGLLNRQTK